MCIYIIQIKNSDPVYIHYTFDWEFILSEFEHGLKFAGSSCISPIMNARAAPSTFFFHEV